MVALLLLLSLQVNEVLDEETVVAVDDIISGALKLESKIVKPPVSTDTKVLEFKSLISVLPLPSFGSHSK